MQANTGPSTRRHNVTFSLRLQALLLSLGSGLQRGEGLRPGACSLHSTPCVCQNRAGSLSVALCTFPPKNALILLLAAISRNGFTSLWEGAAGSAAGIGVKRRKQPTTSNLRGVRQILSINCWNKTGWGDSPQKKIHGRFLSSKQCF